MLGQKRLVDNMIEAYVTWRDACLLVGNTYDSWTGESGTGAKAAFGRYVAALDREEQAAELYAGLVRRVGQLQSRDHLRAEWFYAPASEDAREDTTSS